MGAHTVTGIVLGCVLGIAVGISGYTFIYAKGFSYLTNDSAACANCHIMNDYYAGWIKSSHRSAAVCNDCHTPAGFLPKYATKASNGFWHSVAFTSGRFPEPLRIKPHNREITEKACHKCHQEIVAALHYTAEDLSCVRCHRSVGHLR